MQIDIEINNKTKSPVKDIFFVEVIQKSIQIADYNFLQNTNISISVALVSEKEMQKLNKENRGKDSVTDILSFFEYKNIGELKWAVKNSLDNKIFLGELILCYDDIYKYAREQKIELKKELANVVAHGVLHLLGFAHGEKMFVIQNEIVNKIQNICKE